jgi:hypothetical protein
MVQGEEPALYSKVLNTAEGNGSERTGWRGSLVRCSYGMEERLNCVQTEEGLLHFPGMVEVAWSGSVTA